MTTTLVLLYVVATSPPNVNPGPAGNVQVVILNWNSEDTVNTREFINRIGQETYLSSDK